MSTYRLDKLFSPLSVAVVGGSQRETSPGRAALKNLRSAGFKGSTGLVNPRHSEIEGVRSVKTIEALPGAPDLVAAAGQMGAATAVLRILLSWPQ
jgi:acetyltransferase